MVPVPQVSTLFRHTHLALGRIMRRWRSALRCLALIVVCLCALASSSAFALRDDTCTASTEGEEAFHEEALIRSLPDGKVAFVAHFRQQAPLATNHFETFPKAMGQIVRAAKVADMELSFTQVRTLHRLECWDVAPMC